MDLKDVKPNNIDDTIGNTYVSQAKAAGLGQAEAASLVQSLTKKLLHPESPWYRSQSEALIGDIVVPLHRIHYDRLPTPLRRHIVQLKCSETQLPNHEIIPHLKQFVGSLEGQYLYLLMHPKNIFLAHRDKIIAYSKR
jgi:hypothetical protein